LETPGKTLAQVKNVVNAKAMKAEEVEADEEQESLLKKRLPKRKLFPKRK
jgi:hypothetical protein